MARIVILGAGMMGTAFAWPLTERGHTVHLVGTHLDTEVVDAMLRTSVHPKLGLRVPAGVKVFPFAELGLAMAGAEAIALGVSSAGVRWAGQQLAPYLQGQGRVAMISKGLAWDGSELRILPDVFSESLPFALRGSIQPVAVAGPCIAGELAREVPTCVVFTGRDLSTAKIWAELSRGPYYHVWTNADVVAVEACAALKNAYAMGIGLASGLHAARGGTAGSIALHNYEAAVFAQSIWEMRELIEVLGGDPQHAAGLPGVGDLDVTCNGGRTGRFGHFLGLGIGPEQAIERMQGATLECLDILRTLREAIAGYTAQGRLSAGALPLAEQLASIALDGAPVRMPFERFFAARV